MKRKYTNLAAAPGGALLLRSAGPAEAPTLDHRLRLSDRLGALRVRWGFGRNNYRKRPGLYRLGSPGADSPVLVTANYRLSVDAVRAATEGLDAWLLVLDTKGVNVWCAAGKGTFGTEELLRRIEAARLGEAVSHRTLILPQLGAPGVSAPELLERGGWRVVWGPVRAADIKAFLAAGLAKDAGMRTVRFGLLDRLRVIPMEMRQSWPILAAAAACAGVAFLLERSGRPGDPLKAFLAVGGIWASGSFLFQLLLPLWPGRAFAVKGLLPGLLWGVGASVLLGSGWLFGAALTLASLSCVSFLAMNFTGASTYTSQTGALAEVEKAALPQAIAIAVALAAAIAGLVLAMKGILL